MSQIHPLLSISPTINLVQAFDIFITNPLSPTHILSDPLLFFYVAFI